MGRRSELKCPACKYQVLTSGGPDQGFKVFTNTYVCLYCNSLVDLVTRERNTNNKEINKKDPTEIIGGHQCSKCLGNKFVLWDNIAKLCPRCKTKMTNDIDGETTTVFWD